MNQAIRQEQGLKLRGRLVASHQLPVTTTDPETFGHLLSLTINKAPALFKQAPCVLDVSAFNEAIKVETLSQLLDVCRKHALIPFALTGEKTIHSESASAANLAWLDLKAGQPKKEKLAPVEDTMVITTPVRSGQQIYAKNANLLIMNQVSAGAEVVADGNIHVFGALRGRAIAGACGQLNAEVVCQQMLAELIAIAGTYVVQEDFPAGSGPARCRLDQDSLVIDYLA